MNAISKLPFIAKLLLPLLAILTLWLISSEEIEPIFSPKTQVNRSTDYAMTHFTMTVMDDNGQPSRVITGKQMQHYPSDDTTEITSPIAHFIDQEQDTWIILSNKATTQGKGEDIFLTGNVIITRENNDEIELQTESLHLDTQHNTAYTDSAATIKSPNGETQSVGLHAVLDDKTVNLHSRVKGHYDAPPIN